MVAETKFIADRVISGRSVLRVSV